MLVSNSSVILGGDCGLITGCWNMHAEKFQDAWFWSCALRQETRFPWKMLLVFDSILILVVLWKWALFSKQFFVFLERHYLSVSYFFTVRPHLFQKQANCVCKTLSLFLSLAQTVFKGSDLHYRSFFLLVCFFILSLTLWTLFFFLSHFSWSDLCWKKFNIYTSNIKPEQYLLIMIIRVVSCFLLG